MASPEEQSNPPEVEAMLAALSGSARQEATYMEESNNLRAGITQLFRQNDVPAEAQGGWAIFNIDRPIGTDGSGDFSDPSPIEVLVVLEQLVNAPPNSYPIIRIVTNEKFYTEEGYAFFSRDFTLDDETDCQYFVDAAFYGNDQKPTGPHNTALFWVDEKGDLNAPNMNFNFTETLSLGPDGDAATIFPFGVYTYYEDRAQALNIGMQLYESICDLEPVSKTPS